MIEIVAGHTYRNRGAAVRRVEWITPPDMMSKQMVKYTVLKHFNLAGQPTKYDVGATGIMYLDAFRAWAYRDVTPEGATSEGE